MTLPYFPFYVDDYEADTPHLTAEEDGFYMRLLRLCWRSPNCSIPNDAAWIARKIRCTEAKFKKVVSPLIDEFFVSAEGRVYSSRLLEEWHKAHDAHAKRVLAGKKGGNAKSLKSNETASSRARAMLKQPEPEPEPEPEPRSYAEIEGLEEYDSQLRDTRASLKVVGAF